VGQRLPLIMQVSFGHHTSEFTPAYHSVSIYLPTDMFQFCFSARGSDLHFFFHKSSTHYTLPFFEVIYISIENNAVFNSNS
jgi:hypothetical protein